MKKQFLCGAAALFLLLAAGCTPTPAVPSPTPALPTLPITITPPADAGGSGTGGMAGGAQISPTPGINTTNNAAK